VSEKENKFTSYQWFVIAILGFIQFTVVLDFMVLSPLGAILMPRMKIGPSEFGHIVSAYAFSAAVSSILTASFADKFDRKKLLLFFYVGFVLGTLFCALSNTYWSLLSARIFTGIFGGVIASISMAIITDLFPMNRRGTVMGFVQMAFSASQVLGIPIGLWLANHFSWQMPFFVIVVVAFIVGTIMMIQLKPVDEHLKRNYDHNAMHHLWSVMKKNIYRRGFLTTSLLALGGFMLMPFTSAFLLNNVGIDKDHIPYVFMMGGAAAMIAGPLVGRTSDRFGKYNLFVIGTIISCVMVYIYTHMGIAPMWVMMLINATLFAGITARLVTAQSLMSGVPEPADRGAYMSLNSAVQQMAGGLGAVLSGWMVMQPNGKGPLYHFDEVGYVVIFTMIACVLLMYFMNKYVRLKQLSNNYK
jgi:predicted MFS family arabinose efflux permease